MEGLWTSQRPNNGATRVRYCAVIRPLCCQLRLMPGAGEFSDAYLQDYQVRQFRSQSTARGRVAHLTACFGRDAHAAGPPKHAGDAARAEPHVSKRPFETRGRGCLLVRAAVCRIPCLILCLAYVERQPRTTSLPCPAGRPGTV